jgi:hypothetical protein
MKTKWMLVMGLLLVIAAVVFFQMQHEPAPALPTASTEAARELASAAPVAAVTATPPQEPVSGPAVVAVEPVPAAATASQPAPVVETPRSAARHDVTGLGLTRLLSGNNVVTYEGRERVVLGTKQMGAAESPKTVLLVRDEVSGKVDYWQSGLRIALKPGNDHEAFVKERGKLNRGFVNVVQADVLVDAADIASEYAAILADPRVASVEFLPFPPKVNLR